MAVSFELALEEILSHHDITKEDLREECSPGVRYEIAIQLTNWKMHP